jgi:hypothetical protein
MSFDLELANGDLKIETEGSLATVQNDQKLVQDILKMLFTATGEHAAHPWYGTPLLSRAVGNAYDSEILLADIQTAIQYGLNNIKTLQQLQQRDNQFLTPKELLASIANIEAKFDETDKRKLVVKVDVVARSNQLITETFVVNV